MLVALADNGLWLGEEAVNKCLINVQMLKFKTNAQ